MKWPVMKTLFNKGIISTQEIEVKKLAYLQGSKATRVFIIHLPIEISLIDNTRSSKKFPNKR